jgi:hypothetical protein
MKVSTSRVKELLAEAKGHFVKSESAPIAVRARLEEQIEILEEVLERRTASEIRQS